MNGTDLEPKNHQIGSKSVPFSECRPSLYKCVGRVSSAPSGSMIFFARGASILKQDLFEVGDTFVDFVEEQEGKFS